MLVLLRARSSAINKVDLSAQFLSYSSFQKGDCLDSFNVFVLLVRVAYKIKKTINYLLNSFSSAY